MTCKLCGKEFYANHLSERYCSDKCRRESKRGYYAANIEKWRKYHREYWQKHHRKILECQRKHNNCFNCPTEDGECLFD